MVFIWHMRGVHDELAGLDLNLVLALDALLAERHVTRAAARLGVSQSAASHALARLRDVLGDPLLVRGPRGAMQPTPRALVLAPLLGRALADVAAALRRPEPFAPATARRTFHLGAGDYAELVLLPELAARLAKTAPGIDLFIRTVPDDIPTAIATGELDAVIAPVRPRDVAGPGTYQRLLFEETFVCAVRSGHPATHRRLTLERYCSLDHLLIAPRGTYGGFVEDSLAALRKQRRVALAVPHFLIVPHVVASTDLIVTIASRIAATFADTHRLATLRPPAELALEGFSMHLIWHERAHADDAQRWLRDQIVAVAGSA
jgi:DNA-binding transcriptional LysR family regulator